MATVLSRTQGVLQDGLCVPPEQVIFRDENYEKNTELHAHFHTFGQLLYVVSGVMELSAEGKSYIAPPESSIWLPAHIEHTCYNKQRVDFKIIDFSPTWCEFLPKCPYVIHLSPIFRTIMMDFYARQVRRPTSDADLRLVHVLVDQLILSPCQGTYLPGSKDKLLAPILNELKHNPGDNTSLACWAKRLYTSERTLSRRCQKELGMAFNEWRQRLRFLYAVARLEKGARVNEVALDLGYSSSSAFITMFKQIAGVTPERFYVKS